MALFVAISFVSILQVDELNNASISFVALAAKTVLYTLIWMLGANTLSLLANCSPVVEVLATINSHHLLRVIAQLNIGFLVAGNALGLLALVLGLPFDAPASFCLLQASGFAVVPALVALQRKARPMIIRSWPWWALGFVLKATASFAAFSLMRVVQGD